MDEKFLQRLKILSDPNRFRILQVLAAKTTASCCEMIAADEGGCCVADMVELTGLSQPTVSHHLKALVEADLVIREKRRTWACYFANPRAIQELTAWLHSELVDPDCI